MTSTKIFARGSKVFLSPLTLTLSLHRGEREKEEETFGKPYNL
jgi:hypothetical protein